MATKVYRAKDGNFELRWYDDELKRLATEILEDDIRECVSELATVARMMAPRGSTAHPGGHLTENIKTQVNRVSDERISGAVYTETFSRTRSKRGGRSTIIGYGGYVEYGTEHREATPFLMPAMVPIREKLKAKLYDRLSRVLGAPVEPMGDAA